MQIKTKYFGEIECEEGDILHFREGLFGFEEEKQFLLLPFAGSDGTLLCFQSVVTPMLAFVAMNPFTLRPDYAPQLQASELKALKVSDSHALSFYVLCAVREPVAQSTVNLRCPVAINEDTYQAMQVILDTNEYEMRHYLSEFERGRQASC